MQIKKALNSSDTSEDIKILNTEDEGIEDDSVNNLKDAFNELQLIERGPMRSEKVEVEKYVPYGMHEVRRIRKDSVDSGHYSDWSTNSPSPFSNEPSCLIPFESTSTKNLVTYTVGSEKIQNNTSVIPVRDETIHQDRFVEKFSSILISHKTEEQKNESAIIISKSADKNLDDINTVIEHDKKYHKDIPNETTIKKILENHLNDDVMRKKWLDLAVFPTEDIYSIDVEGLTSVHRLFENHRDDFPEALYTVMEEYKKNPSRCSQVLLDSKDAILESLRALNRDTSLLERYFEVSIIVISMLHDFKKEK